MTWLIWLIAISLGVVMLTWGGAFAYSSAKPRLEARKTQLLSEKNAERERQRLDSIDQFEASRRERLLDEAVRKLAEYDVRNTVTPSRFSKKPAWQSKNKTLDDFLDEVGVPSLTTDDISYINEKYPVHFEKATYKYLSDMRVEAEKESFNELRERHKKVAHRIQEAHEESLARAKEDPYAEEFKMLDKNTKRESVPQK